MPRIGPYNTVEETVPRWKALAERARSMRPNAPPQYHLTLFGNEIRVRLGLFDSAMVKVNCELAQFAERLAALDGRNPLQVVMQRDERAFILGLCKENAEMLKSENLKSDSEFQHVSMSASQRFPWTVDPALRAAVQAAVAQYNAIRAPLVPLPKIERLGYLDENDDILCVQDLGDFRAGVRYPLSTRSIRFTRTTTKPNIRGEDEELELSGQERAVIIKSDSPSTPSTKSKTPSTESNESTFMDASLRAPNVEVGEKPGAEVVQFTLQQLVDHFDIPEVPDIATTDPVRYNNLIAQLHQPEQLTNAKS